MAIDLLKRVGTGQGCRSDDLLVKLAYETSGLVILEPPHAACRLGETPRSEDRHGKLLSATEHTGEIGRVPYPVPEEPIEPIRSCPSLAPRGVFVANGLTASSEPRADSLEYVLPDKDSTGCSTDNLCNVV